MVPKIPAVKVDRRCHVPHFKGLIYAKVDPEAQGRDSIFTICQALLKKAILPFLFPQEGAIELH